MRSDRSHTSTSGPWRSGPRARATATGAGMAWNTPGSDKSGDRSPRRRPNDGGLDALLDRLRGLFGGGGGGGGASGDGRSMLRWVGIALGLWLLFNSFVLIDRAAARRGAALRPVRARPAARPALQGAVADRARDQGQRHPDQDLQRQRAGADPRREHRPASRSTCSTGQRSAACTCSARRDADQVLQQAAHEHRARAGRPLRPGHRARRAQRAGGARRATSCRSRWTPTAPAWS